MEGTKYSETHETQLEHPFERANIISRGCFSWLIPYFINGFKRDLTEQDMYRPLKSHDSNMLGDRLEDAWNYEVTHKENPSLWLALIKVFGPKVALYSFYFLCTELLVLCEPILISKFLQFYEPNQTEMSKTDAYIYASLLVVSILLTVLFAHNFLLHNMHLSMKVRVAASSLIYRKALKLNRSALGETTIGQMVNLLSNDVSRFNYATLQANWLLFAPLLMMTVPYLLYRNVGPTGMVGFGLLLLFIPLLMYIARKSSQYRLKTALRTDERVRLMNEIITGVQVIKMYTWEKPFAKLVEMARRKEMQPIRATTLLQALTMSSNLVLHRTAIYLCILTYVLTGNTINASYAFTVSSFYVYLQDVSTLFFPQAITVFAELLVCVERIKKFLLYKEVETGNRINNVSVNTKNHIGANGVSPVSNKVGVHIKDATVKWVNSLPENILENVSFDANPRQLVAVVGQVGVGKTTLLHVILKELIPVKGTVDIEGDLSYASQEPWLFAGSIRQNIIFSQDFNPRKYEEVVRVCALERDFDMFPFRDQTHVGDRGVTLSGGQKARINLARAVYKDADIYLLDDPLSAVDTQVGRQLFDECICGYLASKCVILVTHQLQYLRNVQTIYLLQDGKVEASGSYTELQTSDTIFSKLLANIRDEKEEITETVSKEDKKLNDLIETDKGAPSEEREERGSGVVSWHVYKRYLLAGGSYFKLALLATVFLLCQITLSATDYFINIWVNLEQWRSEGSISTMNDTANYDSNESDDSKTLWSRVNLFLTKEVSIIIYSCLILASIVLSFTRTVSFFRYCMTASMRLHNLMFNKIVYATMRFFNTNPSGRILNRFSKDIGTVDETMPRILLDTIQIGLTVFSISVIIGSINPWILIPTMAIAVIFYLLRFVFLATTRDIKRVEAVTRSPIYTHLSASLHGLTTIRAFGAQDILKHEFDNIQNQNSAPSFMFIACNRAFGMWLDMHCFVYIALLTINILFISEIPGGNVGLALTQSMSLLGMVQWGMRQWSELENNMTSVERIQQYTELPSDVDNSTKEPPKNWPDEGNVKFENLCLRYSPSDAYILKNITFEIKPKEKIGIVGRTGAGKTSLITALFRLTDIDGKIIVDNINTKEIPLNILRSKISIIPQEPVLFSGTVRRNLDPFDEYNDDVLWSALAEVELKNAVSDLPAGLDSKMSEGGANFSVGQRQLFCLARAIVRNNRILVLDEATANIDPHTDGLIQITIRKKFANCTVLIIAHRLHTIMDSDKVLVMDAGKVVEFDHPHKLLQSPDSVFYGLVMQLGKAMAENLIAIAERSCRNASSL